jgi:transcriptional regulator of arginine metabolism
MRAKGPRQTALLRLVRQQTVSNQVEMVELLRKTGFSVTQASVSRDVRELGLVRVAGRYVPAARVTRAGRSAALSDVVNDLINVAEPVGANLIVVGTPPGAANTVAAELDQKRFPQIAGTLAGDDTVFVAVRSRSAQGRVLALLRGAQPRGDASAIGASRDRNADRDPGAESSGDQQP